MIALSPLANRSATTYINNFKQANEVTSKPFQANTIFKGQQFLPSVVQRQISLTGEGAKASQQPALKNAGGLAKANDQSPSGSSFLKLAALIPKEKLDTMSDASIKELFTKTKDPELKRQLGTEAEIRRNKGVHVQPDSTNTHNIQPDNKEKWAVVSLDDMNRPSTSEVLSKFKELNIPVTLFPMNEAKYLDKITDNLDKAHELGISSRTGVHGFKTGMLDSKLLPGATTAAAAWPDAVPKKGEKQNAPYLTKNTVIRGSGCVVNKWNTFDQHNLKSCTINDIPGNQKSLDSAVKDLKTNGGALSIHLHDKHGLEYFEKVVNELKKDGVQFKFIDQLKGKGMKLKK